MASGSRFDVDPRTRTRVTHDDYTNSGYDRGHMTPNYRIGIVYGERAQMETFMMSNIVPQMPNLNRGLWREAEQLIANDYLRERGELWVLTGPIFTEHVAELRSGVDIPSALFKIVLDEDGGKVSSLALVIPQTADNDDSLSSSLVSIDQIEAASGLDFFSALEDGVETQLEAKRASRIW